MTSTKQKILAAALNLFSQHGYSAVSIRDICGVVGIKESSVYYHFKNKQDIFDTLQAQFLEIGNKLTSMLMQGMGGKSMQQLDNSFFEKVFSVYIEKFLMDDFCNAFIRTLNFERFKNEGAQDLFFNIMFEAPLKTQKGVFDYLINLGVIKAQDSEYLAVQYYAPVYFYYEKYMLTGELTDEKRALFLKHISKHFQNFLSA